MKKTGFGGVFVRKIVSFIVLLICFSYLVGCSGTGIESEPQAETLSQPLVYESVTEYGHIQKLTEKHRQKLRTVF